MLSLSRFSLVLVAVLALAACDSGTEPQADLRLAAASTATASPAVGDAVTFTFTLSNAGPDASTGATVRITPTASLSGVEATASVGSYSGGTWTVPALAVGSDAVLTVTARVATAGAAEVVGEIMDAREANPGTTTRATAGFSSVLRATVTDIFAPTAGIPPAVGGRFAFYSLRENRLVLSSAETGSRADSASTKWDVAFRGTTILVNGGTSGPGQGGALVVETAFDALAEVPATDLRVDAAGTPAVPGGSGNGWYLYNGATNLVTPIPGRTIVVRTAAGTYAKLRILSYYRGNPAAPNGQTDASRYYTFEYVYQPDGSRRFQ